MIRQLNLCLVLQLLAIVLLPAQNTLPATADVERLAITPVVPDELTEIPASSKPILANRLLILANEHGFGGITYHPQFVLVARPVVVEKQIVTAAIPALIKIELETTLYIADYQTRTVFATTVVSMSGLGNSDAEAYNKAFRGFKTNSTELTDFMKKGREGVVSFYNSRCDFILGRADMLDSTGRSEAALSLLLGVPEVCKECFKKAVSKSAKTYQASMERNCRALVQKAKSKWAAKPDRAGADAASELLAVIPTSTKCSAEADKLNEEIKSKMLDLEKWDRKVYEDKREMQIKYLEALRDIGVAQAENQPDFALNLNFNFKGWLW